MKIKICGLTRPEDVDAVNAARADYAGFVFYEKSRRFITPECAEGLTRMLRCAASVGVFVNLPPEEAARICRIARLDAAQLHGDEDNDYIERLKELCPGIEIWKALRVCAGFDRAELKLYSSADRLLLDAYVRGYGGGGKRIPAQLLRGLDCGEFILAGGLTPENIPEAAAFWRPYAVDISSGVETDGLKDREKIMRAVQSCRAFDKGV